MSFSKKVIFNHYSYCLKKFEKAKKDDKDDAKKLALEGVRIGKDGWKYKCRFGFPKPQVGFEFEYQETYEGTVEMLDRVPRKPKVAPAGADFFAMKENPNKLELKMLRNNPVINGHIPEIAMIEKANTDVTVVRNQEQVEEYLTKVCLLLFFILMFQ